MMVFLSGGCRGRRAAGGSSSSTGGHSGRARRSLCSSTCGGTSSSIVTGSIGSAGALLDSDTITKSTGSGEANQAKIAALTTGALGTGWQRDSELLRTNVGRSL